VAWLHKNRHGGLSAVRRRVRVRLPRLRRARDASTEQRGVRIAESTSLGPKAARGHETVRRNACRYAAGAPVPDEPICVVSRASRRAGPQSYPQLQRSGSQGRGSHVQWAA
jgi:hypothetical protein